MIIVSFSCTIKAQYERDTFQTSGGNLVISFIGHGTLMMEFDGKVIHIDPVSQYADYEKLPKADLLLITHHHGDHLDVAAVEKIRKPGMVTGLTMLCSSKLPEGKVLRNGDSALLAGIRVAAVPAYNIKHERSPGNPYHPKGEGNGYILHFGELPVYVAGDTENTPEMKGLKGVGVAFLPMNLPYTMTPEMVADAVRSFKPRIVYPYHYGNTNTALLTGLLKNDPVEVRIRKLQ